MTQFLTIYDQNPIHFTLATYLSLEEREDIAVAHVIFQCMGQPEAWTTFNPAVSEKLKQLRQISLSAALKSCLTVLVSKESPRYLGPWFSVVSRPEQMTTAVRLLSNLQVLARKKNSDLKTVRDLLNALIKLPLNPSFMANADRVWLEQLMPLFDLPQIMLVDLKMVALFFYEVKTFIQALDEYITLAQQAKAVRARVRKEPYEPCKKQTAAEKVFLAQWASVYEEKTKKLLKLEPKLKEEQVADFRSKYIDTVHPMNTLARRILRQFEINRSSFLYRDACFRFFQAWYSSHRNPNFRRILPRLGSCTLTHVFNEFHRELGPLAAVKGDPQPVLFDKIDQQEAWFQNKKGQIADLRLLFPMLEALYAFVYNTRVYQHRVQKKQAALDWTSYPGEKAQLPTPVQFAMTQASSYIELTQKEIDESKLCHLAKKMVDMQEGGQASASIIHTLLKRPTDFPDVFYTDKRVKKWFNMCAREGGWMTASWGVQRHAFPTEVDTLLGTAFCAQGTYPNAATGHDDTCYRLRAEVFMGQQLAHTVVVQYTQGQDGLIYHRYMSKVENHFNWEAVKIPELEETTTVLKKGKFQLPAVSKGILKFDPNANTLLMTFAEGYSFRFYRVL